MGGGAREFLIATSEELSAPPPKDWNSAKSLVDTLNRHLLAAHARGRRTILLVDEAQNLSPNVLEQLRLLTNLETAKQKLLQIILIAQPELRDILARDDLRQLAQRVTGRYHLEPLSREESGQYIDHRLKVAGALGEVFDDAAKQEVFNLSGGVPRIINVICDRAMLGAYSRETRKIGKKLVERAAAEVSGQKFAAGTVQVKIRQADFTTFTRQRVMRPPGNGTDQIFQMARALLHQWLSEHPGAEIRLLGVGGSDLSVAEQRDLFANDEMPQSSPVDETVDSIRDRFGKSSVNRARTLDPGQIR